MLPLPCALTRLDENSIAHPSPCEPAHRHHVALGFCLWVAVGPHRWDTPGLADDCRSRPEDYWCLYTRWSSVHPEILVGSVDGPSGPSLAGTPARMDAGDATVCRSRISGHGGDWARPASGNTWSPGPRGGLPLCLTRHCIRCLSDRRALTSGTRIRCGCVGEWLSMCTVGCECRRPPVGRPYRLAKHLLAAGCVNGGRSRHDPGQSGTVRAQCPAGEPGRSGWWSTERILYASRRDRSPRPHYSL